MTAAQLSVDLVPVRVGIAGLGRAGSFHWERLGLREDCRVVAVYDDCPDSLERASSVAGPRHSSWREFLADENVELVLLAVPPAAHAELALAALAAGKHVLVETPLCLSVAEADAISFAAQRAGRSVCVAHTRRWNDDFQTALAALESGELGEPRTIKFINWHYNPRLRHPGGGTTDGSRLEPAFDWRDQAATGGGLLWEFGVHYFDQLLKLAGRQAESVFASLTPSATADGDDAFLAIANFSGGLVAHIEANRVAAVPFSTGWMIAGTKGSYFGLTQYCPNRAGEVIDTPLIPVSSPADEFYGQLVGHLRREGFNPVPLAEARQTIALIEAARHSARVGQVVAVAR